MEEEATREDFDEVLTRLKSITEGGGGWQRGFGLILE